MTNRKPFVLDASTIRHLQEQSRRRLQRSTPDALLLKTIPVPRNLPCYIAMSGIDVYLRAARIQRRRIETAERGAARLLERSRLPRSVRTLVEVHFYFICWSAIYERLKLIQKLSGISFKTSWPRHLKKFERYKTARDHMEHYLERLPGGNKNAQLRFPGDLGNILGEHYSIGGETFSFSRDSLRDLEAIVRDVKSIIRRKTRETLRKGSS